MAVTNAQKKAVHKYVSSHYDVARVRFPLGTKDKIKKAVSEGKASSINEFISEAVLEKLEK